MESISIEIRENERCPAGLEILLNQSKFTVRLNPKGGVGDFEILNGKDEVILIGQKHLGTISLLEHTSRSEVLTLDLSNVTEMAVACPPTDEIATITSTRMGLFAPNTLEIKGGSRTGLKQYDFKFQSCKCASSSQAKATSASGSTPTDAKRKYNFQVLNEASVVVVELSISRCSSTIIVNLPGQVSLTPVQAAVIFGGLAFQIYSIKKQRSWMALLTMGLVLALIILLVLVYVLVT